MLSGKVASRKFTSKGLLIEVTYDNAGTETTVRQLLGQAQIETMNLVGVKPPAVGQEVAFEFSSNPTTGLQSAEWISINM